MKKEIDIINQKLDLILVKPSDSRKIYGQLRDHLSAIEPPLWAALIAAYVRRYGYSVKIIDADAENLGPQETTKIIVDHDPKLVCLIVTGNNLSASTQNMEGARNYHMSIKEISPKTKTMFWGLHPSALPERTIKDEHSDFVCQGEGFSTIVELLKLLKNEQKIEQYNIRGLWYVKDNNIISNSRMPLIEDLDDIPSAAWDLLPMEKYRAHNWHCFKDIENRTPYGIIYTSLGCPFNCYFCAVKTLFSDKAGTRYRSPRKVIEDIDTLVKEYNVKNIKVLDECFVINKNHVTKICDLIIERGYDLNIWAYARIDTVNEKILKKMKQAGFNWLAYGIESGSEEVRSNVSKGKFREDDIIKTIQMTKDIGIHAAGNFMFGLPNDNFDTMQKTLDLAKEINCEYTNFYVTMAYPGSQLYEDSLQKNIKLPENWQGYSQFGEECLPLPTMYLSAKDVLDFRDKAFVEFHSRPEYIEMIDKKFGKNAVDHIKYMLSHKIKRKLLGDDEKIYI